MAQLLFLFCFVLVLYMFSKVSSIPDTMSSAQDHAVRGLAALRLQELLENVIFILGTWEPGLG